MSFILDSLGPSLLVSSSSSRTRTPIPLFPRTHFNSFKFQRPLLRGNLWVTRFGLGQVPFPEPEDAKFIAKDLFGRLEGFFYTIADSAVAISSDAVTATKQSNDWLSGITNAMEAVLKVLKDGLSTLHVPYSYGFAIILLTVIVKAATFPLTRKQVESSMSMQALAPQIKAIQELYAGDKEKIQLETARLYKVAGINPLAGCLPTLATIPVWIGLYRALSNVADEGLLTEGFFWIPSLSGPTTIASRQTGSGTSWIFPFIDGHPPLGWSDTLAYLVLPLLLIMTQYISIQIMQPPQSNDPNLKNTQAITKLLPLMIGYFALSVPSGLSLYWLTNNILSTTQQVWLRKLGAKNPVEQFNDDIIKKQQSQRLESISEATAGTDTQVVEKEVKLTSDGLRPGERFKLLKEQEAQRRRKREEERRKTSETSPNGFSLTNGKVNEETSPVESVISDDSSSVAGNITVNSKNANSVLKDDEMPDDNNDGDRDRQVYKNSEKR